ncbi:MAG: phosphosulfolactate synthase [Planifilum sp.]|jgi:phosphosulfolactate synthase
MKRDKGIAWAPELADPTRNRESKPRTEGMTMVLDKGLGISAFRDLLEMASDYIDWIKLGFGTAALTPTPLLIRKIELARHFGVYLYPGGTFFEVAYSQHRWHAYLNTLQQLGFEWVEISDGTISLSPVERSRMIRAAKEKGFDVITEIGKKKAGSTLSADLLAETYRADREAGASYVIVEGRESGEHVGIYNQKGDADEELILRIRERIGPSRLIWEAPKKSQQTKLIRLLGHRVNLGNIPSPDVLSLESLRRGLRSDTFPFDLQPPPVGLTKS